MGTPAIAIAGRSAPARLYAPLAAQGDYSAMVPSQRPLCTPSLSYSPRRQGVISSNARSLSGSRIPPTALTKTPTPPVLPSAQGLHHGCCPYIIPPPPPLCPLHPLNLRRPAAQFSSSCAPAAPVSQSYLRQSRIDRNRPAVRLFSSTMSHPVSDTYKAIFGSNQTWASNKAKDNPDLFAKLASGQSPEILWIGCSDSRCPETTILGLEPGDVFVHRNIANVVHPTDLSLNSVVQYAVVHLGVKHIVVCGHTQCGGVAAALANKKLGLIDTWLLPLRSLRKCHLKELQTLDAKESALKLVELNVRKGVETLKENAFVMDAMTDRDLQVHGLIYDVGSGTLSEIDTQDEEDHVKGREEAFRTEH